METEPPPVQKLQSPLAKRVRFHSTEETQATRVKEPRISIRNVPPALSINKSLDEKFTKILQLASTPLPEFKIPCPRPIRGLCKVEDKLVVFDLDTGADISAISSAIYNSFYPRAGLIKNKWWKDGKFFRIN